MAVVHMVRTLIFHPSPPPTELAGWIAVAIDKLLSASHGSLWSKSAKWYLAQFPETRDHKQNWQRLVKSILMGNAHISVSNKWTIIMALPLWWPLPVSRQATSPRKTENIRKSGKYLCLSLLIHDCFHRLCLQFKFT